MNVLSKVRIEKFASRARAYICTYYHLDQKHQLEELHFAQSIDTTSCHPPIQITKQELLYNEIEKLSKALKGHRCALDFDSGFINSQLKEATTIDVSNEDM